MQKIQPNYLKTKKTGAAVAAPALNDLIYQYDLRKFCEVFDCANHLAGVTVFVVIPRNNLNLEEVVAYFGNHSLCCVEE